MRKLRNIIGSLGALGLITLSLLVPSTPAEAAEVAWNVKCGISHYGADDPIVFPDEAGESHMHAFFGNTTTNAATTTASLLAAPSTCERGFATIDHSAYWIPALYRTTSAGKVMVTGDATTQTMTIYYRRGGQANGPTVQPFPQGLRMVAGDPHSAVPQSTGVAHWRCRDLKTSVLGPANTTIPTCASNQFILGVIVFPSCWDGKNLDSADHKSHMAYPKGANSACPSDHPVKLPAITMEAAFRNATGDGSQYSLSSGSAYTLHADFFGAWDNRTQSALVNSCLNSPHKCTGIKFSEVNLAAATTGSGTSGAVLAASTTSAPAQTGSATTTLPTTGPTATAAAVGLSLLTLGAWYYLRSRRRLLSALRRPRQ